MEKPHLDFLMSVFKQYVDPEVTENDIVFMCSYLTSSYFHKIPLNFSWWNSNSHHFPNMLQTGNSDLTRDIVQKCFESKSTDLHCLSWGDDRLWKIGAKGYLNKVLDSMDKIISGDPNAKMEINLAHDTTIAIVLAGMGYMTKINPPHSSTLFIELHQEGGEYLVSVLFNGVPLTYGPCIDIM